MPMHNVLKLYIKPNTCRELQRRLEERIPTKMKVMMPWTFLCSKSINDTLLPDDMGIAAVSIHVFLWGFTALKIFNDPPPNSLYTFRIWLSLSRESADTSQPTSLNFLPISTKAGSRRWETITSAKCRPPHHPTLLIVSFSLEAKNVTILFIPLISLCWLPFLRIPSQGNVWSLCLPQIPKSLSVWT